MLNQKVVSISLAIFLAASFIICVGFGLVTPPSLHMHEFLEMVLPGFTWISVGSFLLGLIESAVWGLYIGLVFVPIHNAIHKRVMGKPAS